MIEPLLPEIEKGIIVLTANRRLARSLSQESNDIRLRSGMRAWRAAHVLPFEAWLKSLWSDAVLMGRAHSTVLNDSQELSLWEQIIRESEAGSELLQPREAARVAAQAWRLLKQYRLGRALPSRDRQGAGHPDVEAFACWAAEFARFCTEHEWITEAELPDAISASELPLRAILCGFDEFTPQQQDLLSGRDWVRFEPAPPPSVDARRASFPDAVAEYRAAANWCRRLLEDDGARRVGIIVPRLTAVRDQVERIFFEELGTVSAFHVSAGKPLAQHPAVRAALLFLRLGHPSLPLSDAGAILRSPYLPGEITSRANLDTRLRRSRQRRVMSSELRQCLSLGAFDALWRDLPRMQAPSDWASCFERLLEAAGWPGNTGLSSAEYQSRGAFLDVLQDLASHDLTTPAWDFGAAYERLTELADRTEFAPEDEGAPIQVMGVLESAGSQFDALWVTGLHDGAWPQPGQPNPFLPVAMQRERNLPHSSDARELEFSRMVTARLLAAAPQVIFSWPRRDKDAELRPSPLLSGIPESAGPNRSRWIDFLDRRAVLEEIEDSSGPPFECIRASGGTRILQNQSACPFRAFAEHRLGAKPLDEPDAGLGPADRGKVLHRALDMFWRQLGSSERLTSTSPEDLAAFARKCVDRGFRSLLHGTRLREIESDRLSGLMLEWLEVERRRAPFRVAACEDTREVEAGGLQIETRIDRVDEVAGGRQIIIDYKANAPALNSWEGDRPAEPQVPLYASKCATNVAAALFANLRPGELKFAGIADEKGLVPDVRIDSLPERIREWSSSLDAIALQFANGRAAVDPRRGACDNCRLAPLCRISELRLAGRS